MYQWRNGSVHRVDANIAGQALDKMRAEHGCLTAEIVVEDSRPDAAPLHEEFDWEDELAATKWRNHQARNVINSIRVVVESDDDKERTQPLFVHVVSPREPDGETEPRYVRVADALADQRLRREVLTRALREMDSWERRYNELEELAAVFEGIGVVRSQLVAVGA